MICPACELWNVDSVKSGNWAYDDLCAICIEKKQKQHGEKGVIELNSIYKPERKTDLELYNLEILADCLARVPRKRKAV